jgi:hypothetical protein
VLSGSDQSRANSGICLGLIATPGLPADLVPVLMDDLQVELERRFPSISWYMVDVVDALVTSPADDVEIVEAARERLLAEDWDLAICLTDLPLQISRRPVVAHASALHGVGVVSVPALGAVAIRRRAMQAVVELVEGLLGAPVQAFDTPGDQTGRSRGLRRRARQLGREAQAGSDQTEFRFTARVLTGNIRLLLGMVRANRPWRLAVGLSRALTAAVAAGVFALVTSDIWMLADGFGRIRFVAVGLVAVTATVATLIVGAHLWERAPKPQVRKQVALFNIATTATVVIGVLSLYAALFLLAAAAAVILVVPSILAADLGHPVGTRTYLALAWLTSSLATVGGALGAGLESDDAVRQAAYSYRPTPNTD